MEDRIMDFGELITGYEAIDRAVAHLNKLSEAVDHFDADTRKAFKRIADNLKAEYKVLEESNGRVKDGFVDLVTEYNILVERNKDGMQAFKKADDAAKKYARSVKALGEDLLAGAVPGLAQMHAYLNAVANDYDKLDDEAKNMARSLLNELEALEQSGGNVEHIQNQILQLAQTWELVQRGEKHVGDVMESAAMQQDLFNSSLKRLTEVKQAASDSLNGLRTQLYAITEDYKMLNAETRMTEGEELLGYVSELTVRYKQANQALQDALNPMKALKNEVVKAFTFESQQLQVDQAIKQYIEDIKTIETQINDLKLSPDLAHFETTRERLLQQLELLEQGTGKRSKAVQDQIDSINSALVRLDSITQGSQLQNTIAEFESLKVNTEANLAKAREEAEAVGTSFNNIMNLNDLANKSMAELQQISSQLHGVYKNMNPAELSQYGDKILQTLLEVDSRLDGLKDKMNEVLKPKDIPEAGSIAALRQQISNLSKEIEHLPDINSALGVQKREELEALKERLAGIQEELRGSKKEVSELDKMRARLAKMQEKNAFMRSDEYAELSKLIDKEKEEAYVIKQNIQIRNQAEYSVKQMEATLRLYKFQFDRLPNAIKKNKDAQITFIEGNEEVTMSVNSLIQRMDELRTTLALNKEAFGDYTMNVGNYKNSFDGLTFSVVQVVRELPSLAVNANTFFLAISNNIPMVIDEINRVRKAAAAAKEEVPSVFGVLKGAMKSGMFWLNVFMAVFFTLMSRGEKVVNAFFNEVIRGGNVLRSTKQLIKDFKKEVEDSAKEVGKAYIKYIELQNSFVRLKTTFEKNAWIKKHKSDLDGLGVAVRNITEAENLFIKNTNAYIRSLTQRAMATAAMKAAEKHAEKAFEAFMTAKTSQETLRKSLELGGYDPSAIGEDFATAFTSGAIVGIKRKQRNIIEAYRHPMAAIYNGVGEVSKAQSDAAKKLLDQINTAEKATRKALQYQQNVNRLMNTYSDFTKAELAELEKAGLLPNDVVTYKTDRMFDISKYIRDTHLKIKKLYNDIKQSTFEDDLDAKEVSIYSEYGEKAEQLANISKDLVTKLAESTKAITAEERALIDETLGYVKEATEDLNTYLEYQLELLEQDRIIKARSIEISRYNARLDITRNNIESEFKLRRLIILAEMEKEIAENNKLTEDEKISEERIRAKYFLRMLDLQQDYADKTLKIRKNLNDAILANTPEYTEENYKARLDNIYISFTNEVNRVLTESGIDFSGLMSNYAKINSDMGAKAANAFLTNYIQSLSDEHLRHSLMKVLAEYQQEINKAVESNETGLLKIQHDLQLSNIQDSNTIMRTLTTMRHEIEDLELQLRLAEKGIVKLNADQMEILRNKINQSKQQLAVARLSAFEQYGLLGGFLANIAPGFFGTDQLNALDKIKQQIISSLNEILDAEIAIREKERELAKEKVDEAKRIYDQEVEARNNGFAHSVSTAKNELMLHKKTLEKKQADLEKAERAKAAVDAASQASSLTTAVAGLWQAFAPLGLYGIIAAAVATAGMFGAFIASKAKAAQLTSNYGQGGYEVLRGGSHSSGNDIDLGTTNRRGRRMRAEGGEGLAIFNRRSTSKYKNILPGLVKSINDGTYLAEYTHSINSIHNELHPSVNLNNIEQSLGTLISQGKRQVYENGNTTIVIDGNKRRTIKRLN